MITIDTTTTQPKGAAGVCPEEFAARQDAERVTLTIHNTFHRTTGRVRVTENDFGEYRLSATQAARLRRALCGIDGCVCGAVRDPHWTLIESAPGQWWLERKDR